jgi:hypothetical protein
MDGEAMPSASGPEDEVSAPMWCPWPDSAVGKVSRGCHGGRADRSLVSLSSGPGIEVVVDGVGEVGVGEGNGVGVLA